MGFAQDADSLSHWKYKMNAGVNLNQASFSSNWKAGGSNSIGLNSNFHINANYAKGKTSWDNEVEMLYGFVKNEGQGARKTIDRLFLDTKLGHKVNHRWSLFASLNFLSQFREGFRYEKDNLGVEQSVLISDFLAPAFVTSSIGAEYTVEQYFNIRISPMAPRITIVRDVERFIPALGAEPYGVPAGESTRTEPLAFQLLMKFNKEIATNINLQWRYMMYANYETLTFDQIDHRLDVSLKAAVTKFLNMGLNGIFLYDYDQDHEVQLSQVFTIGLAYTLQNYEDPKK